LECASPGETRPVSLEDVGSLHERKLDTVPQSRTPRERGGSASSKVK
jgi:hypothetical protein